MHTHTHTHARTHTNTHTTGAVSVTAGNTHTCAVLIDTRIACWGGNPYGQLGTGDDVNRHLPTAVIGLGQGELYGAS